VAAKRLLLPRLLPLKHPLPRLLLPRPLLLLKRLPPMQRLLLKVLLLPLKAPLLLPRPLSD
jgi:hypothetical protein